MIVLSDLAVYSSQVGIIGLFKEAFYRHSVNKGEMVQVQKEKLLDHSECMFLALQIYDVDRESN